jgi:hypothetical protein
MHHRVRDIPAEDGNIEKLFYGVFSRKRTLCLKPSSWLRGRFP